MTVGTAALIVIILFFLFLFMWGFRALFVFLIMRGIGAAVEKGKNKLFGGKNDDGSN